MEFYFCIYWEFHSPNWRTHIFQRGGEKPPTSVVLMDVTWRLWISLNGSSWDVTGLSLIFFCWWYECDVIGFYGISGRNVVVFFVCNFEPLSKMLAARNVMKCAARKDWHLAFGISRSNIYRFHDQTKDLMGYTMVIVNWEEWVRQSIT